LDFLVFCSSATSLVGGVGQVDYCAANAYIDAFARDWSRRSGTWTVAIDWDRWQNVGMAVDTAMPTDLARQRDALLGSGMTPDDGVEAFRRILAACTVPQIAVLTTPLALTAASPRDPATGATNLKTTATTATAESAGSLSEHV